MEHMTAAQADEEFMMAETRVNNAQAGLKSAIEEARLADQHVIDTAEAEHKAQHARIRAMTDKHSAYCRLDAATNEAAAADAAFCKAYRARQRAHSGDAQ